MGAPQGQHTNTRDRGTLKRPQFTTEKSDRSSTKTVYRDTQQKQVTELESREGKSFYSTPEGLILRQLIGELYRDR